MENERNGISGALEIAVSGVLFASVNLIKHPLVYFVVQKSKGKILNKVYRITDVPVFLICIFTFTAWQAKNKKR